MLPQTRVLTRRREGHEGTRRKKNQGKSVLYAVTLQGSEGGLLPLVLTQCRSSL